MIAPVRRKDMNLFSGSLGYPEYFFQIGKRPTAFCSNFCSHIFNFGLFTHPDNIVDV